MAFCAALAASPIAAQEMALEQCEHGLMDFGASFPPFSQLAEKSQRLTGDKWCELPIGADLWPVSLKWRSWVINGSQQTEFDANFGPLLGRDPGCDLRTSGLFHWDRGTKNLDLVRLEAGWDGADHISVTGRIAEFDGKAMGTRFQPIEAATITEMTFVAASDDRFLEGLLSLAARRHGQDVLDFRDALFAELDEDPVHPSLLEAQSSLRAALASYPPGDGRLEVNFRSETGLHLGTFIGWLFFGETLTEDGADALFHGVDISGAWRSADVTTVASPCGRPLSPRSE